VFISIGFKPDRLRIQKKWCWCDEAISFNNITFALFYFPPPFEFFPCIKSKYADNHSELKPKEGRMKRYLMSVLALTLILALLPMTNAAAQMAWEGGVKGGINLAKFWGDDAEDLDYKIGAVGGAFVMANVSEMFGVRLEGLYSQKGAKATDDTTNIELKAKFDYIEFPVLAVLSFAAAEKMNVNVFAGPAVAFLVSAKGELAQGGVAVEIDVKDFVKSLDFGGVIGAGFSYDFESAKAFIEGRYTIGLISTDDTDFDADEKNSALSIMGGFSIPFGGGGAE
jgi:hypothetical protein